MLQDLSAYCCKVNVLTYNREINCEFQTVMLRMKTKFIKYSILHHWPLLLRSTNCTASFKCHLRSHFSNTYFSSNCLEFSRIFVDFWNARSSFCFWLNRTVFDRHTWWWLSEPSWASLVWLDHVSCQWGLGCFVWLASCYCCCCCCCWSCRIDSVEYQVPDEPTDECAPQSTSEQPHTMAG